ncbi:Uncharacterized protein FWK35_00007151 [Aphis craccivora]|uniref:Uncharacterized protein n=1 Tax=Aphis craccivora TaxID=307492 RepID=A0A6G0ZL78_APHCR|nr:Uncharacterized protein FWK35_00007151 [Aphis craccivora]
MLGLARCRAKLPALANVWSPAIHLSRTGGGASANAPDWPVSAPGRICAFLHGVMRDGGGGERTSDDGFRASAFAEIRAGYTEGSGADNIRTSQSLSNGRVTAYMSLAAGLREQRESAPAYVCVCVYYPVIGARASATVANAAGPQPRVTSKTSRRPRSSVTDTAAATHYRSATTPPGDLAADSSPCVCTCTNPHARAGVPAPNNIVPAAPPNAYRVTASGWIYNTVFRLQPSPAIRLRRETTEPYSFRSMPNRIRA